MNSITTGVDILKIQRLENIVSKKPGFINRVYGKSEIEHYYASGENISFLAGNFCAKEAFSKALGTGVRKFSLRDVQILRDQMGKPYFVLSSAAGEIVSRRKLSLDVSISHEQDYAVAFVVAWE